MANMPWKLEIVHFSNAICLLSNVKNLETPFLSLSEPFDDNSEKHREDCLHSKVQVSYLSLSEPLFPHPQRGVPTNMPTSLC